MLTLPGTPLLALIVIVALVLSILKDVGKRRTGMSDEEFFQMLRENGEKPPYRGLSFEERRKREREDFNRKFCGVYSPPKYYYEKLKRQEQEKKAREAEGKNSQ